MQTIKKQRYIGRSSGVGLADDDAIGGRDLSAHQRFASKKVTTIDSIDDHNDLADIDAGRKIWVGLDSLADNKRIGKAAGLEHNALDR